MMRVMVLVKATNDSEVGMMPSTELLAAMGRYNEELVNAGILLAGEGLHPSMKGKRVAFDGPTRTVWPLRRDPRAGRRLLAMEGQRHGRGGRVGEALPESDAGPERDRNSAGLRHGRLRRRPDAGSRRTAQPDPRKGGQVAERRRLNELVREAKMSIHQLGKAAM
jgi:hypothetical protein